METTLVRQHLSKSKYMAGHQCPKQLWLRVREPDAAELVPGIALQDRFDQGHEVSVKAREYVPGGVLIEGDTLRDKIERTREVIAGGAPVIYEAAVAYDGVLVIADILEKSSDSWRLIEVKSSTKVKPEHLPDVAVQLHLLRGAGLDVRHVELMHLNRDCRFPDLSELFVRVDLTAEAEGLQPEVRDGLASFKLMLEGPLPVIDAGPHCTRPYDCPFVDRCNGDVDPYSLRSLYRPRRHQIERLQARGCESLQDIPTDVDLPPVQDRQREAALRGEIVITSDLRSKLSALEYPVAHLDFETVWPSIPVWEGCRPYQQVPVQISMHLEEESGRVTHQEWIAEGPRDPRKEMARQIVRLTAGARTILAYNASFERSRIRELKAAVPELAVELDGVLQRLVDLLPIVREHVYHPNFAGSFSLKSVLPALVPDIGYAGLDIADGETASVILKQMLLDSSLDRAERAKMRASLIDYCSLDTYAMVRLLSRLRELAGI